MTQGPFSDLIFSSLPVFDVRLSEIVRPHVHAHNVKPSSKANDQKSTFILLKVEINHLYSVFKLHTRSINTSGMANKLLFSKETGKQITKYGNIVEKLPVQNSDHVHSPHAKRSDNLTNPTPVMSFVSDFIAKTWDSWQAVA